MILTGIRDIYSTKIVDKDREDFLQNLDNWFGVKELPAPHISDEFKKAVKEVCEEMKLECNDIVIDNVWNLYFTSRIRHGFATTGENGNGKTATL